MTGIWVEEVSSFHYKIPIGPDEVITLTMYQLHVRENLRYVVEGGALTGDGMTLEILAGAIANFATGQADQLRFVALAALIYDEMDEIDEERFCNAQWN